MAYANKIEIQTLTKKTTSLVTTCENIEYLHTHTHTHVRITTQKKICDIKLIIYKIFNDHKNNKLVKCLIKCFLCLCYEFYYALKKMFYAKNSLALSIKRNLRLSQSHWTTRHS